MTCLSLARRRSVGDLPDRPEPETTTPAGPGRAERAAARLRQDDALAQLARFVLVGASSTVLYALLFLGLHRLGYLPAHVIATVISSMVANDLHRRLTFHAEDRVSWLRAQWEAGGVSLIGLLATSGALAWLDATAGNAPAPVQIGLVIAVTAFIGALRFVALRWIFRPQHVARATEDAVPA